MTARIAVLLSATLGLIAPIAAAQPAAPPADGPTIDETQGSPGTQSGAQTQPGNPSPDMTGSTGSAPNADAVNGAGQTQVDQDTQSEKTGLQKKEGQPGTQSGTPPLAE
jgi:hypothetical protein